MLYMGKKKGNSLVRVKRKLLFFTIKKNLMLAKYNYAILASSQNFKTLRAIPDHLVLSSRLTDKKNYKLKHKIKQLFNDKTKTSILIY